MKSKAATWGLELLALLAAFLAPIHHYLTLVGVLVLADFIVGTWASVKKGQSISSRRMRETVGKILAYETAVVVGYLVDGIIGLPDAMIARIVAGFIGLTEAKSIFENLSSITGLDFWTIIVQKLKPQVNNDKEMQALNGAGTVTTTVTASTTKATTTAVTVAPEIPKT